MKSILRSVATKGAENNTIIIKNHIELHNLYFKKLLQLFGSAAG